MHCPLLAPGGRVIQLVATLPFEFINPPAVNNISSRNDQVIARFGRSWASLVTPVDLPRSWDRPEWYDQQLDCRGRFQTTRGRRGISA